MMVADQAEADFDRARRRACFGGLRTRFVGGATVYSLSTRLGKRLGWQIDFTWAGKSSRYLR